MASCPSSNSAKIFDPIRKKWVVSSPEERVRQRFLSYLILQCGFPKEVITVEKSLAHVTALPREYKRRCDLLCYAPRLAFPLLLVECKTTRLKESMFPQLWGYNAYIQAPFIALVNQREVKMGWQMGKQMSWYHFIPPYRELIGRCAS